MSVGKLAVSDGMVALDGGGQEGAPQISPQTHTRIGEVGTDGDSVMLPPAVNGTLGVLTNGAAANSADVFPMPGESINALDADTAVSLPAGATIIYSCPADGAMYCVGFPSDVSTLQTQIAGALSDITTLQGQASDFESRISALETPP